MPSQRRHTWRFAGYAPWRCGPKQFDNRPYGGVFIFYGDRERHDGEIPHEPLDNYADGWDAARLCDATPAQVAHALDRRVVCDLLGFDNDIYRGVRLVAAKWCAEPSVHGGKARPAGAAYVV